MPAAPLGAIVAGEMASRTTRNAEPWRWSGPRVVIEHPDEEEGLRLAGALRDAGFAVAVCSGPDEATGCPLAGPGECAIARDADAIVSYLEAEVSPDVLAALRARCPSVPLIIDPLDVVATVREALDA